MSRTLVLCYHSVSNHWPSGLAVTQRRLEWQVRTIIRRGYRPVGFTEAMTTTSDDRRVSITFDDAYLSVFELAAPVLGKLGVPACVYAPTAWIGRAEPMSWPGIDEWIGGRHERELIPMTWDQLRSLQAAGWEIGSHSCTHPHLTTLDRSRLDAELEASKQACEESLGVPCRSLAYPYGDVDDPVAEAAARAGYEAAGALSVSPAAEGPFRWPRIGVYGWDDRVRFLLKLSPTATRLHDLPIGRWINSITKRTGGA